MTRIQEKQASHTPGPWEARVLMVVSPKGETIAHLGVSNDFSPPRPDECVANARLMAAAPDLLKALSDLTKCLRDNGYSAADLVIRMQAADAAIDKAEGRK